MRIKLILILTLGLFLTGCEFKNESMVTPANLQGMTAKRLFSTGEKAMVRKDFEVAIKYFEALDSQFPFSQFTEQNMLNMMYCYHKNGDHAASAATASRYIKLYPRAKRVDYAYYMKGIAEFDQDRTALMRHLPVDVALRDLTYARQSYNNFSTFINRFPNSPYAADASQRMIYLRNLFARKELSAAKFYFERKAYVAAANRASYVVHHYQQAPEVAPALVILVKANRKLGLHKEAADALHVLKTNYPNYRV